MTDVELSSRPRTATAVFLLACAAGLFFCGWSTAEFVQHLDRQPHAIHCSFVPGLAAADASGTSGCAVALMSPYSSVLRSLVWGGIPATLAGMAVFAFLLHRGLRMLFDGEQGDPTKTRLLVVATLVPVLTSLVYGYIAIIGLDALCKLCIGIYLSSFAAFGAAIAMAVNASAPEPAADDADPYDAPKASPGGLLLGGVAQGTTYVLAATALYVALVPDFSKYIGACGELDNADDPDKLMVPVGQQANGPVAIEVMDPLCPACAGFEERLSASGSADALRRRALLFPLDNTCNWMLSSAMHPGACTVSEAILCAGDQAEAVLAWAFDHHEEIRTAAAADPAAAGRMVGEAFPAVNGCLGTDKVKQRLNRGLRWAVRNELPVLTPQLYVEGRKLCDEDTDLGLDWALPRLIAASPTR